MYRQAHHKHDFPLIMGRASWWMPSQNRGEGQKQPFMDALKDFLRNVSFHCYGMLVEEGRRFSERLFWLGIHLIAFIILIMFLWHTSFDNPLLTTTVYNPRYPIEKVAFPAASICTINRISNVSAWKYALKLSSLDPDERSVRYFYNKIHVLSYNYNVDDDLVDFESATKFQRFLDLHDTEDSDLFYNTRKRMKMLTPRCSDVLLECRLGGEQFNCSKEFEETLTSLGYCCTFNKSGNYSVERKRKMSFAGQDNGLVLLLNSSTKDYFFKTSPLDGFVVFIYSHENYADISSGAIRELYIQSGVESFIAVTPTILETIDEARFLPPNVRKCLFADEMSKVFGKAYTFNKCITRCRIRSIEILCNCLMFVSPEEYLDLNVDTVLCTLQHKECLQRYDFKWANVIIQRQDVQGLEREMEDALYCPRCLPSCTETNYKVAAMGLPLSQYKVDMFSKHISEDDMNDLSLIHIFFAESHTPYYQQILQDSWFEVFSRIGNICGVITGFSLIGICEVFFFLVKQFWIGCRNEETHLAGNQNGATQEPLFILP